jgi:acetyl/propionyl-CoA carboxylase alpha subunit
MNHKFCFDGRIHSIEIDRTHDGYLAAVDGQTYEVTLDRLSDGELQIHLDGKPLSFYWAADGPLRWIWLDGQTYLLDTRVSLAEGGVGLHLADKTLRSPMPGQVVAVYAAGGDAVRKGQSLILLEAMKMEIRVQAPRDGRLGRVLVEPGQTVERDQPLVELSE